MEGGGGTNGGIRVVNDLPQLRPLRVDTSVNSAHLSTIAEGISPARQSSTGLVSPRSEGPASERSVPQHWIDSIHNGRDQDDDTTRQRTRRSNYIALENGPARSEGSLRNKLRRHFRKPRLFTIPRLGISIQVSHTSLSPTLPPPSASNTVQRSERAGDMGHPPLSDLNTALNTPTVLDSPSVARGDLAVTQTAGTIPPPEPAHPDRPMERSSTHDDKHERIRVKRREATLKRKAGMIARCECQSECHCRNGSFRSDAASFGPESSERSIHIPEHHLHRILSESTESSTGRSSSSIVRAQALTGIGSHVHFGQGDRSMDDSTSVAIENQHILDDRLSQASTAYLRSNGSSISLLSRVPSSLRRSNTAPGGPSQRPAEGLRPQVIEALQNRNIPDHAPDNVLHAGELSESSESDVGEISSTAPGPREEVPDGSPNPDSDAVP
ncbi:MAG: hypothetical protein L6R41_006921 [Letrouitia leprolyta]|nr:MAG: hypothetical protein L6R41_006921 [Letrouitia leprolyta]